MRGKLTALRLNGLNVRITPADAGKTSMIRFALAIVEDHPRGCGENRRTRGGQQQRVGSPPRMRGKLGIVHSFYLSGGITPADAGKTRLSASFSLRPQDHPRGCGENCGKTYQRTAYRGSPPRMRGKPSLPHIQPTCVRITPADAGKTLKLLRRFGQK